MIATGGTHGDSSSNDLWIGDIAGDAGAATAALSQAFAAARSDAAAEARLDADAVLPSTPMLAGAYPATQDRRLPLARVPKEGLLYDVDLQALVCAYDWGAGGCDAASAVIACESGWDAGARNGESYGLWQIHWPSHYEKLARVAGSTEKELLYDPAINTAVAWLVYTESGGGSWLPWSCRP